MDRFGPYTLVKQIASGGMAEVYLARAQGIDGFEKDLALKIVSREYGEDSDFVQMLVEEAKLSVQLSHNNIVQVFDLGKTNGRYYLAMEYVEGIDLYGLLVTCADWEWPVPFDLVAYIGAQVSEGLHYAHTKAAPNGTPLNIVHRDISPQNILISTQGEVKICDFGIARAESRAARTKAGMIKGKFYYMSPEQAWGRPLDFKTDIFSTGICLYEVLAGAMLYTEADPRLLLRLVRKADIRPIASVRPDIPEPLADIVMKSLAWDSENRWDCAAALGEALTVFRKRLGSQDSRRALGLLVEQIVAANGAPTPNLTQQSGGSSTREKPSTTVLETGSLTELPARNAGPPDDAATVFLSGDLVSSLNALYDDHDDESSSDSVMVGVHPPHDHNRFPSERAPTGPCGDATTSVVMEAMGDHPSEEPGAQGHYPPETGPTVKTATVPWAAPPGSGGDRAQSTPSFPAAAATDGNKNKGDAATVILDLPEGWDSVPTAKPPENGNTINKEDGSNAQGLAAVPVKPSLPGAKADSCAPVSAASATPPASSSPEPASPLAPVNSAAVPAPAAPVATKNTEAKPQIPRGNPWGGDDPNRDDAVQASVPASWTEDSHRPPTNQGPRAKSVPLTTPPKMVLDLPRRKRLGGLKLLLIFALLALSLAALGYLAVTLRQRIAPTSTSQEMDISPHHATAALSISSATRSESFFYKEPRSGSPTMAGADEEGGVGAVAQPAIPAQPSEFL